MNRARAALLLTSALALAAGCTTSERTVTRCRDIPANGCPVDQGEACGDPVCAATYACDQGGTWSLVATCPGHDGGPGRDATAAPSDATAPVDVTGIDVPPGANGGPGCVVALQPPDCPLGLVLACASASSTDPCCGCESLFVCGSGGWNTWGVCSAEGGVVWAP